MNTQPDFEDFFRLLESNGVEYMVVGGYAVAFHGYPRFTKDIDVFFEASPANAARLRAALVAFGFQAKTVPDEVLLAPEAVIAIGVEPAGIDLLNRIDGVSFEDARSSVVRGRYGTIDVTFIGRDALSQACDAMGSASVPGIDSPERFAVKNTGGGATLSRRMSLSSPDRAGSS